VTGFVTRSLIKILVSEVSSEGVGNLVIVDVLEVRACIMLVCL
jgi:hypothetical protein